MKSLPLIALATVLGSSGCFWVTTKSEGAALRKAATIEVVEDRL